MELDIGTIIAAIPNMVIAVWVIWRDGKTIAVLLENQQSLIETLMALHPPQAQGDAKNIISRDE